MEKHRVTLILPDEVQFVVLFEVVPVVGDSIVFTIPDTKESLAGDVVKRFLDVRHHVACITICLLDNIRPVAQI